MLFERPQENEYGWYVATTKTLEQYLHTDGKIYTSTLNPAGKHSGYFTTELEAYRAMYDYNITL